MATPERARIARPEVANVRAVWPDEAADFTPWLAANLEWLEDLGLGPLSLVETEVTLPDTWRSLDLLVETADGRRIAIENQYGEADHDHLTRGLAYAVGLDAKALVVIAEGHRQEFRAVADYLNRAHEHMEAGDGIAVLLVELTVEQIGDTYIPRFTTCSEPNEWRARSLGVADAPTTTVEKFLAATVAEAVDAHRDLIDAWAASPRCSVVPQTKTISLRLARVGQSARPRALFTLEPDGRVYINAGLLHELHSYADEDELSQVIRGRVPGATETGQGVWWRVTGASQAELLSLADLVMQGIPPAASR